MKVLISGAAGLVGSALTQSFEDAEHTAVPLSRSASAGGVPWSPTEGKIDRRALEGFDVVIHLAGENIAAGRWTRAKKAAIYDSRVEGTNLLCNALAELDSPPKALVSASAVGYYGDRGEAVQDEDAPPGDDFLAQVCVDWENATAPAAEAGIRVVNLRFGVILSEKGGALKLMLVPFRLGVGGVVGNGKQYMSWVTLREVVSIVRFVIENDRLEGPVNTVAPSVPTNREFTKTLGRVLHRPTVVPLPAFAARLALGEMADALLLASTRVEPRKLLDSGYKFTDPDLEQALRSIV